MKLKNLFGKEKASAAKKGQVEKMEKNQLDNIVGGGAINTSRSNIKTASTTTTTPTATSTSTTTYYSAE